MIEDIVELDLTLHASPPGTKVILVSDDGDETTAVWLPRSLLEYNENASEGDTITVILPVWLATSKRLI